MDRPRAPDKGTGPVSVTMAVMRVPSLLSLLLACTSIACAGAGSPSEVPEQGSASAVVPTSDASSSEQGQLESVRPGINERYFEDGAVEQWSEVLERERREVIALRDQIVAELALEPGMVVADIGAGTGAFISALSASVGDEGTVYAVDIVPAFLAHLEARAREEGVGNLELIEATPTDASLPEASVDLLFMSDVYHHIEYPSIYLQSLYRALRPGGRLVIVEFDRIPGKTSERMMKHVRQDQATLVAEVTAEGFVLEREIESIPFEENYMLEFGTTRTAVP